MPPRNPTPQSTPPLMRGMSDGPRCNASPASAKIYLELLDAQGNKEGCMLLNPSPAQGTVYFSAFVSKSKKNLLSSANTRHSHVQFMVRLVQTTLDPYPVWKLCERSRDGVTPPKFKTFKGER